MPQQTSPSINNNFSKGFFTEYTGLNFPEDAVIDTRNCIFERIGNAHRRPGINYEGNFTLTAINRTGKAVSYYKWKNVGGDGLTQVFVTQVDGTLRFYKSSAATTSSPLSAQLLASTVDITAFVATGGSFDSTQECQFTDGNGYLFVFHPSCDPFYVVYTFGSPDTVSGNLITIKIRDFQGVPEAGVDDNFRPPTLSNEHQYNLQNQGWVNAPGWTATSTTANNTNTGSHTWTIQTGLTISNGQTVNVVGTVLRTNIYETGTVTSYNSGTGALVLNITSSSYPGINGVTQWTFASYATSTITTWHSAEGNYPSNADVWWAFKNSSNNFDPTTTVPQVTLNAGPAPKAYYILEAFNQQRSAVSSVPSITNIATTVRPKTGSWFAGRIFYTGVDAQQNATGDAPDYTWTENIYFSQIIQRTDQFGKCYQINDPTSQTLFGILPSDGGVLKVQGSGSIYRLFPIQNGLLVFAANGVWFITGSSGIGFTANDYTITKVSAIQSISSTSFVDVRGTPMWWNEEGIYSVEAGQGDEGLQYGASRGAAMNVGLKVQSITFTTIQTFYQNIPLSSKKHVKGDYDSLNWTVRWIYRSTEETGTTDRYQYDSILVHNTVTKAFYPWSLPTSAGVPYVNGIAYIQGPGGSTSPLPVIKYLCSVSIAGPSYNFTFAEENDTATWTDWTSNTGTGVNFTSYFVMGYRIKGNAQRRFQSNWMVIYLNNNVNMSYKFQALWDYAINRNSNKYTNLEQVIITDSTTNFAVVHRRHKLRGRGLVQQIKITSVDGSPFDIFGWSVEEKVNTGL